MINFFNIFFNYSKLKDKVMFFSSITLLAAQVFFRRGDVDPENRLVPDVYLALLILVLAYYGLLIYRDARFRYTTLKTLGKI